MVVWMKVFFKRVVVAMLGYEYQKSCQNAVDTSEVDEGRRI